MFQSSPSFEAGRYEAGNLTIMPHMEFQSSPSFEAGCYVEVAERLGISVGFQSSPSFEAGRYHTQTLNQRFEKCSNPHPALRLGAT